jgi:hypothetical protein
MLRVPSGVVRLIDFDARGDFRVVELGGLAYVVLHVFGDLVARIDGFHRAFWHAHGAVDALSRVDHELVIGVVDAIHRARPYASRVLRADTQFGNNIGHALPLCSVGRLLHTSIIPARSPFYQDLFLPGELWLSALDAPRRFPVGVRFNRENLLYS